MWLTTIGGHKGSGLYQVPVEVILIEKCKTVARRIRLSYLQQLCFIKYVLIDYGSFYGQVGSKIANIFWFANIAEQWIQATSM